MDLKQAETLAMALMMQHGLIAKGWRFKWDGGKRRFGCCSHSRAVISLSRHLTTLNSEEQVKDTILHEIAHALTPMGYTPHGKTWKAICVRIGANPNRCYDSVVVNKPTPNYEAKCDNCGERYTKFRLRRDGHYYCTKCGPLWVLSFNGLSNNSTLPKSENPCPVM